MSNSLKDALLGLGFKAAPEPPKKPKPAEPRPHGGKPAAQGKGRPPERRPNDRRPPQGRPGAKPAHKPSGTKQEFDLGKATARRAHK
jgi:hypothetical protein